MKKGEERALRKKNFTIEYTFRHPLLKRKLVVLGDVTVRCLSLVDLHLVHLVRYLQPARATTSNCLV